MGADQGVTLKEWVGARSVGKVLLCSSSGVPLVWIGDMGVYRDNVAAVRGSTCEFPAASHT